MIDFYTLTDNRSHGHDASATHREGDIVFVAVADGITSSDDPLKAAETALDCALNAFRAEPSQHLHSFVRRLKERLESAAANWTGGGSAEATLTAVVLQEIKPGIVDAMFAAAGDSPIYIAYPGPIMDVYPDTFLTSQIHGKPIQVENSGRVYSFVDCSAGRIMGRLAAGTFQITAGELCILCTDGVPFNEYVLRDLRRGGGSHRFFNELVAGSLKDATDRLFSRFQSEKALSDDATLVAVSVRMTATAVQASVDVNLATSGTAERSQDTGSGPEASGPLQKEPNETRDRNVDDRSGLAIEDSSANFEGQRGVSTLLPGEERIAPEGPPRAPDAVGIPSQNMEESPATVESGQTPSTDESDQSTSSSGQ